MIDSKLKDGIFWPIIPLPPSHLLIIAIFMTQRTVFFFFFYESYVSIEWFMSIWFTILI